MRRLALTALILVGLGCGGADGPNAARDAGVASEPELDAEIAVIPQPDSASPVDSSPEAALTVDAQPQAVTGPCNPPYERVYYYPPDEVFCGPTNDVRLYNPCAGGALPVWWGGGGVVRCGRPDGGID